MTPSDVSAVARELDGQDPLAILRWAIDTFASRLTFAIGFGAEGCALLDLIGRHALPIDVFTLDTGLLFPETYELWRALEAGYALTIRAIRPALTIEAQATAHGSELWQREPDRCCDMRKIVPLRSALTGFDAWITAIRRDQTPARASAQVVEHDHNFGLIKINPLVAWTKDDVWAHLYAHDVPHNPLHGRGYASIGCAPCTSPVALTENPRAGRWRGTSKQECGLHARGKEGS